jgi:hypothetical protein
MSILFVLGAGFSKAAGSPLANELFEVVPFATSRKADSAIQLVMVYYTDWRQEHPEAEAEAFVTHAWNASGLFPGAGALWTALVYFLALRVSEDFARFYVYNGKVSRSSDNIFSADVGVAHDAFWDAVFDAAGVDAPLAVLTTNWDIWIERGLRPRRIPRRRRPGFHYGDGPERLIAASTYPRSEYRRNPVIDGTVPLLKLHGSLSWAIVGQSLEKYGDLRPGFRGDAAIIPPLRETEIPSWLHPIWQQAESVVQHARVIVVVGYSFPEYDSGVRELFQRALGSRTIGIHIFDPSASRVAAAVRSFLPRSTVEEHGAIPEGCGALSRLLMGYRCD